MYFGHGRTARFAFCCHRHICSTRALKLYTSLWWDIEFIQSVQPGMTLKGHFLLLLLFHAFRSMTKLGTSGVQATDLTMKSQHLHNNVKGTNCILTSYFTHLSRHLSKHEQAKDKLTSNMKVELSENIICRYCKILTTTCLVDCQSFCSLKIWRDIREDVIVQKYEPTVIASP